MAPHARIAFALACLAACRGATVSSSDADPGRREAGAPSDAGGADGGRADTNASLTPTMCGPAKVNPTAPTMIDHAFWGYHGIGTDGEYAYYPAELDGKLYKLPLVDGGRPAITEDVPYLRRVRNRGSRVCWLANSVIACRDKGGPTIVVHRAPPTGPSPESWDYHRDFDFDDHDAYWIDLHSVWRAPLDGSGPAVRLIDGEETTTRIAVAGERIVWSTDTFQVVRTCEKKSCNSATELASWGRPPWAIIGLMAGDADHVYVPVHLSDDTGRRGGKLFRIPTAGGAAETLVECLDESPNGVFLEDGTAYLLAHAGTTSYNAGSDPPTEGGSIYALPSTGGTLQRLATNQPYPAHITMSSDRLLWINEWARGGQVMSLPR